MNGTIWIVYDNIKFRLSTNSTTPTATMKHEYEYVKERYRKSRKQFQQSIAF